MKRFFLALLCAATMTAMEAKTLVAYFSATGTTKAAAERLAKQHDARLWEIEPAQPYTAADLDWRNDKSRSSLLEGKILIPFATSGSSGIADAEAYLKKTYPSLNWQKGLLMNKR